MDAIYHKEVYNRDLMGSIDKYDTVISDYMKERTNGRNDKTWTESISKLYQKPYATLVSTSIIKQGYQNK
jgi:FMN reductase [NAD(P)H]